MKTKFGAIIVAGSGKIGGHVASRNRGGSYLRTKVTPLNPKTNAQQIARNRLSGLSSAWKGLTQEQRYSWNSAVLDFQKTDVFGDIKTPSGFNLHQKLNNNLLAVGEAALAVAPASEAVDSFDSLSVAADTTAGTLLATFSPAIAADHKVKVFATPAVSPGKQFVQNQYRLITVLDDSMLTGLDLAAVYEAKFGPIGAAGQKIAVSFVQVNTNTGQEGVPISSYAVISA